MRTTMTACAALVAATVLAGCSPYSQSDRALGGAGIGAVTGAVIGGAATGRAGGAVAGAVVGGATGAIVGAATTPRACIARDAYGRRVRVPCP
jgi:osmotically inducible lipoprotein OsmB